MTVLWRSSYQTIVFLALCRASQFCTLLNSQQLIMLIVLVQFRQSWLLHSQLSAVCQHLTEVRSRTGARLQSSSSAATSPEQMPQKWDDVANMLSSCSPSAQSAGALGVSLKLSWTQTISWIHVTLLYININSDPTCR